MIYNLLQYLENSAERCPDKIALEDEFGSVTYKEYVSAAKAIGTYIYIYIPEVLRAHRSQCLLTEI